MALVKGIHKGGRHKCLWVWRVLLGGKELQIKKDSGSENTVNWKCCIVQLYYSHCWSLPWFSEFFGIPYGSEMGSSSKHSLTPASSSKCLKSLFLLSLWKYFRESLKDKDVTILAFIILSLNRGNSSNTFQGIKLSMHAYWPLQTLMFPLTILDSNPHHHIRTL